MRTLPVDQALGPLEKTPPSRRRIGQLHVGQTPLHRKSLHQAIPVLVVDHDILPAITPRQDAINRVLVLVLASPLQGISGRDRPICAGVTAGEKTAFSSPPRAGGEPGSRANRHTKPWRVVRPARMAKTGDAVLISPGWFPVSAAPAFAVPASGPGNAANVP